MRTLSRGNRKEFAIFSLIIILILGVFIATLNSVMATEKKEYTLNENTITFDEEYNIIEIDQDSKLYKKWDKNFYLKKNTEEFKIGKNAIDYNNQKSRLSIYGNSFEVITGGEVKKFIDHNEITKLALDRFFKLEDRKYLIIGEKIQNTTGSIDTKNFLIVQLDKNGNTLLANDEISVKTIKPMKIVTESYEFDVANEKLLFKQDERKEEIDLKKIIGSSNEYIEIKPEENQEIKEKEEQEKVETELEQINGVEVTRNNQGEIVYTPNTEVQETVITQNQAISQDGQNTDNTQAGQVITINQPTQSSIQIPTQGQEQAQNKTDDKGTDEKQSINKTPLAKSINLRGITARATSLDIQYAIIDTENKYQTVFLDIQGDTQKIISLDKSQRNYLVTGLTPNREYKVTLSYKEILPNNSIVEGVEDTMIVRTTKISDKINIVKLAKNKIYFNYKMDSNYVYDSGKLVLYVDGERKDEMPIDTANALNAGGWTACFNYSFNREIVIKLEELTYEGKEVQRDLQARIKLY